MEDKYDLDVNLDPDMFSLAATLRAFSFGTRCNLASDKLPEETHLITVIDEEEICSICREEFVIGGSKRKLPCGHTYHYQCIAEWEFRSGSRKCPICRHDMEEISPQTIREQEATQYHDYLQQERLVEIRRHHIIPD